ARHTVPFAVAGFTAMHPNPDVVRNRSVRHTERAGVDDLYRELRPIAGDAIVSANIGFGAIEHNHAGAAVIAKHIFRTRRTVTAVERQMAVEHGNAGASVSGDAHAAVNVEGAARC